MGMITSLFARKMVAAADPSLDKSSLLAAIGLDPNGPGDPTEMIADTDYYALLERIAASSDATELPLRGGASMRCDDYGALGLAWKAAPDLKGSFSRVERFARLWTSVVEYELRSHPRGVLFILHRDGPRRLGLRLSNEATLASGVSLARQTSPQPFSPLEVWFQHAGPQRTAAHEAYFGCPVRFAADLDALLLSPESLAQPNLLGDEGITGFLISHLEQALSQIGDNDTLKGRTKEAIARALSEGLPRMAEVARGLGLSTRSFHRRLADEGLTFQTLTEETRRELAEGLLREDQYSLAEVAFLTGFAEQSSFTRAFKRWVGHTPAQYRKGGMRA